MVVSLSRPLCGLGADLFPFVGEPVVDGTAVDVEHFRQFGVARDRAPLLSRSRHGADEVDFCGIQLRRPAEFHRVTHQVKIATATQNATISSSIFPGGVTPRRGTLGAPA